MDLTQPSSAFCGGILSAGGIIWRRRPLQVAALVALLAIANLALAATESRDVAGFERIEFSLPGELVLEQGDFGVTLEGKTDDLEKVVTEVSGKKLEVRWRHGGWLGWGNDGPDDKIRVVVSLPLLTGLEIAGSGDAGGGTWNAEKFQVTINGSGSVDLDGVAAENLEIGINGSGGVRIDGVDAAVLDLTIRGSGDVDLAGAADTQHITVAGSGDLDAADLEGANVTVGVMGSGNVKVWARETLDANVMGSGDVRYRGEAKVDRMEAGSGRVRPL
ncbi:MAG: head GIN domain-containing protein [Pseudomonadales bacterium]